MKNYEKVRITIEGYYDNELNEMTLRENKIDIDESDTLYELISFFLKAIEFHGYREESIMKIVKEIAEGGYDCM